MKRQAISTFFFSTTFPSFWIFCVYVAHWQNQLAQKAHYCTLLKKKQKKKQVGTFLHLFLWKDTLEGTLMCWNIIAFDPQRQLLSLYILKRWKGPLQCVLVTGRASKRVLHCVFFTRKATKRALYCVLFVRKVLSHLAFSFKASRWDQALLIGYLLALLIRFVTEIAPWVSPLVCALKGHLTGYFVTWNICTRLFKTL